MSGKTDDIAHDLQNGIDLVMDDLKKIRDKVPCSCGQEVSGCEHGEHEDCMICSECHTCREDLDEDDVCMDCGGQEASGDISVETSLEIESIARWIHAESDEPISEIEDLLLRMSTKDFYDEYAVVLKDLKERVI